MLDECCHCLKAFDYDFNCMERVRLVLGPERLQWMDAAIRGASKIQKENSLLEVWCKEEMLQPQGMHHQSPKG